MKLKLDENLGVRGRDLLTEAGHDLCTIPAQNLCSATDEQIAARCRSEGRGAGILPAASTLSGAQLAF